MNSGNPDLIRLIRAEIENRGPQSFSWFMQQALYHPQHGYYSSGRCVIGRKGDYFTNVSVGALFGHVLAAQFTEIWNRLGQIDNFVIVEQGAHDGAFAHDVLEFVQKYAPAFFKTLRYRIVEPFHLLERWQSKTLEPFREKVEWRDSLHPFTGVHFSNELLDAMPVRLITGAVETLVGITDGKFVFVKHPLARGADKPRFNQPALNWVDEIAANLQHGYLIAIDYGRADSGPETNVQVRARHRKLNSPFEKIGEADITMCVDWRSIAKRARKNGLRIAGFTDQHHFLTGIISGLNSADRSESLLPESRKEKRELQTLLHPEMLGRAFQVLALAKNAGPETPPLAGFKFAREPCSALNIDNSV